MRGDIETNIKQFVCKKLELKSIYLVINQGVPVRLELKFFFITLTIRKASSENPKKKQIFHSLKCNDISRGIRCAYQYQFFRMQWAVKTV